MARGESGLKRRSSTEVQGSTSKRLHKRAATADSASASAAGATSKERAQSTHSTSSLRSGSHAPVASAGASQRSNKSSEPQSPCGSVYGSPSSVGSTTRRSARIAERTSSTSSSRSSRRPSDTESIPVSPFGQVPPIEPVGVSLAAAATSAASQTSGNLRRSIRLGQAPAPSSAAVSLQPHPFAQFPDLTLGLGQPSQSQLYPRSGHQHQPLQLHHLQQQQQLLPYPSSSAYSSVVTRSHTRQLEQQQQQLLLSSNQLAPQYFQQAAVPQPQQRRDRSRGRGRTLEAVSSAAGWPFQQDIHLASGGGVQAPASGGSLAWGPSYHQVGYYPPGFPAQVARSSGPSAGYYSGGAVPGHQYSVQQYTQPYLPSLAFPAAGSATGLEPTSLWPARSQVAGTLGNTNTAAPSQDGQAAGSSLADIATLPAADDASRSTRGSGQRILRSGRTGISSFHPEPTNSASSGVGRSGEAGEESASSAASNATSTARGGSSSRSRPKRGEAAEPRPKRSTTHTASASSAAASATSASGSASATAGSSSTMASSHASSEIVNAAVAAFSGDHPPSETEANLQRLQTLLEAKGVPPHVMSRMQQLISNTSSGGGNKGQQTLDGLQSPDCDTQLCTLGTLCETLLFGNEDTLVGFPYRQLIPLLVTFLEREDNFEMMTAACRALFYMMESLPRTIPDISKVIPVFLKKLEDIQFMDLAEQALCALEVLSKTFGGRILKEGGLTACLSYLDFFQMALQRSALAIAANCCLNLKPTDAALLPQAVQSLSDRLQSTDKKSLESVCLCFVRLADNLAPHSEHLETLAGNNLLKNVQQLLVVRPMLISSNTLVSILLMVEVLCKYCPKLAVELIENDFSDTLRYLLVGHVANDAQQLEISIRSPKELHAVLCIVVELLPPLPSTGIFGYLAQPAAEGPKTSVWSWRDDDGQFKQYSAAECQTIEAAYCANAEEVVLNIGHEFYYIDFSGMQQVRESSGYARSVKRTCSVKLAAPAVGVPLCSEVIDVNDESIQSDPRSCLFREKPELICHFSRTILPVLFEVRRSMAGPAIRRKCMMSVLRLLYSAPASLLSEVLADVPVSSLIAQLLTSPTQNLAMIGIVMSAILMEKLPDIFQVHFRREGVMHAFQCLVSHASPPPLETSTAVASATTAGASSTAESSSTVTTVASGGVASGGVASGGVASAAGICATSSTPSRRPGSMMASYVTRGGPPSLASLRSRRSGQASAAASSDQASSSSQPASLSSSVEEESPGARRRLSDILKYRRGRQSASYTTYGGNSGNMAMDEEQPPQRHRHRHHSMPEQPRTPSTAASASGSLPASAVATASSMSGRGSRPADKQLQEDRAKRDWVLHQAKYFTQKHFADGDGDTVHPALVTLDRLSQAVRGLDPLDIESSRKALMEIAEILSEADLNVSAFETMQCGVVETLCLFLTSQDPSFADLAIRWKLFLHIYLHCPDIGEVTVACPHSQFNADIPPPIMALVAPLQTCVAQMEQFVVKVHDFAHGGSGTAHGRSIARLTNSRHLQCVLVRHPNCHNLKRWKRGQVRIDPMATIQAIERHMVERGYGKLKEASSAWSSNDSDDDTDAEIEEPASAGGSAAQSHRHSLEFLVGDNVVPHSMTIYNALKSVSQGEEDDDELYTDSFWENAHVLYYRPVSDDSISTEPSSTSLESTESFTSLLGRVAHGSESARSTLVHGEGGARSAQAAATPQPAATASSGRSSSRSRRSKSSRATTPATQSAAATPASSLAATPQSSASRSADSSGPLCEEIPMEITEPVLCQPVQSPLYNIASSSLKKKFGASGVKDPSIPVLELLRIIEALNRYWYTLYKGATSCEPIISPVEFINSKLAAKAYRQLQDPIGVMTGHFPVWLSELAASCTFVLPFHSRHQLFCVSAFDRERALLRMQETMPELANLELGRDGNSGPRLEKKKFVVKRDSVMASLDRVLERAGTRAVLEMNFDDEAGTGLGPTLEFYSMVSREFQATALGIWRDEVVPHDSTNGETAPAYVHNACGLFPNPTPSSNSKVFYKLGRFVARALQDSRMVDLPFSSAFCKWILREEEHLCVHDLQRVDKGVARSVLHLLEHVVEKERIQMSDLAENKKNAAEKNVASEVTDLMLNFTVPGTTCELVAGGSDRAVTLDNLEQYLQLLSQFILVTGVKTQMEQFREGFSSIFHVRQLRIFYPDELPLLFCGSSYSQWQLKDLNDCSKPDHGYTLDSPAIKYLFDIMTSFTAEEQRQFLMFLTGCPRLPVGGFRSLHPPLKIVKKAAASPLVPDDYLPSVMTCAHFLKLPDYSSRELMQHRLTTAMQEGQQAFHLS